MNFTQIPNDLLEDMPLMNRSESAITAILIRYTYGFHREDCRMTWADFMHLSGMSKSSVQRGIKEVNKRGYFVNDGSEWYINHGLKTRPKRSQNETKKVSKRDHERSRNETKKVSKRDHERSQNETKNGIKMRPYTNKGNKEEIKGVNKGPAHFERFEEIIQEKTAEELAIELAVKGIVRNPQDTLVISDIALIALGADITPEQIKDWFAGDFWYKVSLGKTDGMPPFARNILNDLLTAQKWEWAGCPLPGKKQTQPPTHDPTMPKAGQGGAW